MDRRAQRAHDLPPRRAEATKIYPPEQTIRSIKLEIPIWLTEEEISELETRYGIELAA